jgi:outer membrane protein OmpA-like peptidoglycan-associated protein
MVRVMKTRTLLLGAVATIAFGFAAQAQERNGWYIGLEGGWSMIEDTSAVAVNDPDIGLPTTSAGDIVFSDGWAAIATVGHHFGRNWRWEVEVGYRANDFDLVTGEVNEWSGMLNVLYDIPLTNSFALSLGLGAGGDNMEVEGGNGFQDREWNFAYQGIAGLTWAVSDRFDLFANYRYFRVSEPEFESRVVGPAGLQTIVMDDVVKHTATLGLRYNFGAKAEPPPPPPPVAPPPPPPAAPKEFIVFFGHNKSNLTPEAIDVVRQAAAAAKEYGSATITVVGHADKSGSPAYNEKLSLRRADGVKGALVGEGIEAAKITTSGRGESDPMVPTEDGVREPQNRRVHINL